MPTSKTYTLTNVQADHTVEATFKAVQVVRYTITALAGPGGTMDPSGIFVVDAGTDILFAIAPDPGFEIDTIKVDGVDVTADAVDA